MSEFANGSLAMYHHPLTGSFSYAGNFTAADFLAPIDGEEAEDLFILMALGKAYVSRAGAAAIGWVGSRGFPTLQAPHPVSHPLPAGQHPHPGLPRGHAARKPGRQPHRVARRVSPWQA